MKILALEFSSRQRSVAAVRAGAGQRARVLGEAVQEGGTHTLVFGLIEEALGKAGWRREEVDSVAVGLGPGSYTGIRMAISVAQGWQLARGVRLLGISSVEALAYQAYSQGMTGRTHFLVDAQRQEYYLATYDLSRSGIREGRPLSLLTLEQARTAVDDGGRVAGPDTLAEGPGTHILFPGAGAIGCLAADRTDYVSGNGLEPIYLREARFVKAPPPRVI